MTNLRSRLVLAVAGVILTAIALSGCATASPELQETTAARFQLAVLDVTKAAHDADYATAQAKLADLQSDLLAAAASDQVSAARTAEIQSAINDVGTDLAALKAEADAKAQAEADAAAQAAADAAAAAAAAEAAKEAANAPPAAPAPPAAGNDDGTGKGDKGKGDCKKGKDGC